MTQTTLPKKSPSVDPPQIADASRPPIAEPDEPAGKPARPWSETGQTWTYTDEPIFKLSVEAYHELIRLGHIASGDPVELIEGVLVHRMTKNPPHAVCKARLVREFDRMLPSGWFIRTEDPITLIDGEPEPDIALVRGTLDDYGERHPTAAEVGLVVEVADVTLRRDRGSKRLTYARGGIGAYWIVNLKAHRIEVHTEPDASANPAAYPEPRIYGLTEKAPVWLDGKMIGEVAVRDVMPGGWAP